MSKLPVGAELWRVADVRAWLKCSRSTLYRYMARKDFPTATRPPGGGHPRWLADEVRKWRLPQDSAKAA